MVLAIQFRSNAEPAKHVIQKETLGSVLQKNDFAGVLFLMMLQASTFLKKETPTWVLSG